MYIKIKANKLKMIYLLLNLIKIDDLGANQ